MAHLKVIGSNSSGNSYALQCKDEILLIEAGLSFKNKILPVIGYKANDIVGCLISHRHLDHAADISNIIIRGIPTYSNQDVASRIDSGVIVVEEKKKYNIGGFKVQCVSVPHGDCPCYSFIIEHEQIGKLLFITDASDFLMSHIRIKDVDHLFVEANYDDEIIDRNAVNDKWNTSASSTHMGINKSLEVIKRHYSPRLKNICLLHLSDGNSDKYKFKRMVYDEVGITPYIAESGLNIELRKEDF